MRIEPKAALAATMAMLLLPQLCRSAVVITGVATAQAGNNGNPAVQKSVSATADGSYATGPLSGPDFGGNTTQGALTIASQPSPTITATASGSDSGVYAANGGTSFVSASYTFDFNITGPTAGIGVPIVIEGSTDGIVNNSGDPSRWNSAVGTRVEIISVGGVYNFGAVGAQSGTAADLYSGSVQDVRAAWGQMASAPVNYSSYAAYFAYGATVLSGTFATGTQVLKLATIIQGGTRGVSTPSGLPSSGSAESMLNARVYIDQGWLNSHPGYTLLVDAGVGTSPVPEPSSGWLLSAGLIALAGFIRRAKQA